MALITLDRWLALTFDDPPSIGTARRWAKAGKIHPRPVKHGRSYYVDPAARYTDDPARKPRLIERIDAASPSSPLTH